MTTIWQWVTCNSAGLQGVAAIVGAVIAFLGLIVLCIYVWDTRTIAKSTVNQSLDRFIPILTVTVGVARDGVTRSGPFRIRVTAPL